MQQVIYVHGGEVFETRDQLLAGLRARIIDDPTQKQTDIWSRCLERDLGEEYQVIAPQMPNKWNATFEEWEIWFEKYVPYLKNGCVLVGWSLGANFLAKYLSLHTLPVETKSLHLISGCFGAPNGFEMNSLKNLCSTIPAIHVYHSKDDIIVPFDDSGRYTDAFPCAKLHVFTDRGHFFQESFPELIAEIQK